MDGKTEVKRQSDGKRVVLEPDREKEYALPLSALFDELMAWDLDTGICRTIFYTEGKTRLSVNRTMGEIPSFAWKYIHPEECRQFQLFFQVSHMKELRSLGQASRMVFRQRIPQGEYTWVEAVVVPSREEQEIILCYVHDLGKEEQERYMLKRIVDRYVYRDCDYLLCLDAGNDSYDILQSNDILTAGIQPGSGIYSGGLEACARLYAVPEDREMLLDQASLSKVLPVLDQEGEYSISYGVRGQDGDYMRKQLKYVYYDKPGRKILLMCRDITGEYNEQCRQKKKLNDALLHARIDSLTGLFNRQAVSAKINSLLAAPMAPTSVLLFMDLDNFKTVNDTLGHRYGDKVLSHVSECFRQTLRSGDIIGRVGGDEFVAFLTGVTSLEEAGECAGRLCQAVSHIQDLELQSLRLSCSIGVAVCPRDGRDYETLLLKADVAVYEAKRRGKNQTAFYEPGMERHGWQD